MNNSFNSCNSYNTLHTITQYNTINTITKYVKNDSLLPHLSRKWRFYSTLYSDTSDDSDNSDSLGVPGNHLQSADAPCVRLKTVKVFESDWKKLFQMKVVNPSHEETMADVVHRILRRNVK